MAGEPFGTVVKDVERLYRDGTLSGLNESELLDRFLVRKDELAFETLVTRHGPMVLSVCRGVLRDDHAAEDAFQATFLLLVRKGRSIRTPILGPWLHRVAYRVAIRAGKSRARHRMRETPSPEVMAATPAVETNRIDRESRMALHEALDSLPARYREPIVLCYLEGRTHDEAAKQLRWPVGSVKGRLSRGRDLLKTRLQRRGVGVPAVAIAAVMGGEARASVPLALKQSTVQAAVSLAAGKSAAIATGAFSVSAMRLAEEAARAMMIKKSLTVLCSLAAVLSAVGGAAALARQDAAKPDKPPTAGAKPDEAPKKPATSDLDLLQGSWLREWIQTGANRATGDAAPKSLQRITIQGDVLSGTVPGSERVEPRTLKLEPNKIMKQFEWTRKTVGGEEVTRGIYKLDHDSFLFCFDTRTPQTPPASFPQQGFSHSTVIASYIREPSPPELTPEAKAELERLQGEWRWVRREENGESVSLASFGSYTLVYRGDSQLWKGQDEKIRTEQKIVLDLSQTPHTMEMRSGLQVKPGRMNYRLEGDRLITCFETPGSGRSEAGADTITAPGELATRPGDNRVLTVYQRVKPPAEQGNDPFEALNQIPEKTDRKASATSPRRTTLPPPTGAVPAPAPRPNPEKGGEIKTGAQVAAELRQEADRAESGRDDLLLTVDQAEEEIEALKSEARRFQEIISNTKAFELTSVAGGPAIVMGDAASRMDRLKVVENAQHEIQEKIRSLTMMVRSRRREAEALDRVIEKVKAKADAAEERPGLPGTVQPGDVLVVEVLEALPGRPISGERVVKQDGTISLGFYGYLKVEGLTPREIKVKVIEHMQKYLIDEALGLIGEDPRTGKFIKLAPEDSDRVFVDDEQNAKFMTPDVKSLKRQLDDMARELKLLKASSRPARGEDR